MGRRKKIEKKLLETADASPEARGLRVKRVRNMANLSRQQMCSTSDININSLKGWEIGRYGGLTDYGAEKIMQRVAQENVQCTIEWLMYGIGTGPTVQGGFDGTKITIKDVTSHVLDEEKKIVNELILFRTHYKYAIDFIVEDDGMMPIYKIGEYVAGVNLFDKKINTAIGLDCIVQLKDGKILIRQLRKGNEADTYTLICVNTNTTVAKPILYDAIIVSAAPIIFHRKKMC